MNKTFKNQEYYIGLDCGTSSVGWAVTDKEYNLLRFNGKDMWGSHLFDEASTAAERRTARCARRRLRRRHQRLMLLQEIFAEEIYKVDPCFFIRLNDSKYLLEDKKEQTTNIIFNDDNFKDKDYFKKYPTIYHLRQALMNERITDPRLLYLGIAHILKHRGHFLFPGSDLKAVMDIGVLLSQLSESYNSVFEEELDLADSTAFEEALKNTNKTEKKRLIEEAVRGEDSKRIGLLIKALLGYKVKTSQLFDNEEYKDLCDVEFKKASFEDEDLPALEDALADDEFKLVSVLKALFDWSLLSSVMSGEPSISAAKVKLFNQNSLDLKSLKYAVKTYAPEKYDSFFHSNDPGSFSAYVGKNHDSHKSKEFNVKRSNIDVFYSEIKKVLKNADNEDPKIIAINKAIDEGTFLSLLVSYRNGVIPWQVNQIELECILNNSKSVFTFLGEVDEEGFSKADKIRSLLNFRIPYYVGPIGKNPADKNTWAERRESGRIRPWNFSQRINIEKSAESFILRMTNKCTYCKDQDVIPKNSLGYSKFMVLNELNNLRIKGFRLTVGKKQEIFENLFKKYKKVTLKKVYSYAIKNGWYSKEELTMDDFSGIDGDFKASLGSHLDFSEYLKSGKLKADEVEEIIKWLTVFEEGGEILEKRIFEAFGKRLTKEEVKRISKLKYSGWGRFSHKFLYEILAVNKETGELLSVMGMLWNTQNNLMELLSSDYEFTDQIDKPASIGKLDYSVVDQMYVSPAVKRQSWQTLRIVDELVKVMGHNPKKVFIEVTRHDEEKNKRTVSRKNTLIDRLKAAQKAGEGFDVDMRKLIASLSEKDESQIARQDKLYLYYSQCGRSMYSGKPINIEDLYRTDIYDIDHIYPYSKSNDDSLNNKVLVLHEENTRKSNSYPVDDSIRAKMQPFWKMLYEKQFIGREKYERLTRTSPLSEEDCKGFINRQLVETNQNVKASATILKAFFGDDTKIVYSKAGAVSEFRNDKNHPFPKCRSISDLHHAKDAYLNIVVGNTLDTKYSSNFYRFLDGNGYGNLSTPFRFDVTGAWKAGEKGTIQTVKKVMNKNSVLFTRQPVENNGALFDLQIVSKGSKKGALPVKTSDEKLLSAIKGKNISEVYDEWTSKYGGYNSLSTAYFALVSHNDKKARAVTFVPISIIDSHSIRSNEDLEKFCGNQFGLVNPKTVIRKLLINTTVCFDGYKFAIAGKASGGKQITLKNNIPLVLSYESTLTIKKMESFLKKKSQYKNIVVDSEHDGITDQALCKVYDELMIKGTSKIYKSRPGSQQNTIKNGKTRFDRLPIDDKVDCLMELLKYYGPDNGIANFVAIGGSKACGTLIKSSKVNPMQTDLKVINSSITGLFSSVINISV